MSIFNCDINLFSLKNITYKQLTYGVLSVTSIYVLFPSFKSILSTILGIKQIKADLDNKRWDKYTAGISNKGNDCYINSSLQALSALQNLTIYLNEYIRLFVKQEETICEEGNHPEIAIRGLLHESLCNVCEDLQELILQPKTISNDQIVQSLERIFRGKISRDQNDAHEFVQILLERLYEENKMLHQHMNNELLKSDKFDFPFKGTISSHYFCTRCQKRSEIQNQDQFMWELSIPQRYDCSLQEIIENDGYEMIQDYSCLYCQASALLANEANYNFSNDDLENENIRQLKTLLPVLKINSDIPDRLLYYIKNYNKNRCVPSKIKTTIIRKSDFSQLPKSLIIHLSRSVYNGMVMTRNSCRVSFPEILEINQRSIDEDGNFQVRKVKYSLKAMVKHTGSHYQGHYQCYKQKPRLVMDNQTKQIINKTPTVIERTGDIKNDKDIGITNIQGTKRFKTIKTVKSLPFWLISDNKVKEVKNSTLQNESKYVYMLYYEL